MENFSQNPAICKSGIVDVFSDWNIESVISPQGFRKNFDETIHVRVIFNIFLKGKISRKY